jgi:hypothetical protein
MKRTLQALWFSTVILAGAIPLGGCQNDNEAEVAATKGTADPKYAADSDANYEAYAKDQSRNRAVTTKAATTKEVTKK